MIKKIACDDEQLALLLIRQISHFRHDSDALVHEKFLQQLGIAACEFESYVHVGGVENANHWCDVI
jgi:hypothetical protein